MVFTDKDRVVERMVGGRIKVAGIGILLEILWKWKVFSRRQYLSWRVATWEGEWTDFPSR